MVFIYYMAVLVTFSFLRNNTSWPSLKKKFLFSYFRSQSTAFMAEEKLLRNDIQEDKGEKKTIKRKKRPFQVTVPVTQLSAQASRPIKNQLLCSLIQQPYKPPSPEPRRLQEGLDRHHSCSTLDSAQQQLSVVSKVLSTYNIMSSAPRDSSTSPFFFLLSNPHAVYVFFNA